VWFSNAAGSLIPQLIQGCLLSGADGDPIGTTSFSCDRESRKSEAWLRLKVLLKMTFHEIMLFAMRSLTIDFPMPVFPPVAQESSPSVCQRVRGVNEVRHGKAVLKPFQNILE